MLNSLNFTGVLLIGFGGLLIAMAIFLFALASLHKGLGEKIKSWLGGGWYVIADWPCKQTVKCAALWVDTFINKAVATMILDYERSPVFGAIATAIFIVILPCAALVNALQGGSPFMLYCYGLICLSVVYQLFTAEIRFNAALRSAMAGISAFLLVFALPYYAAWSLTEHLMNRPIFLSVMASVLVANVLYAGTAGLGALVRTGNKTGELPDREKLLVYFLFAIPVFYVLYWLIIFAGSTAYDDTHQMHDPRSLLVSVGFGAVSFALIKLLIDRVVARSDFGRGMAYGLTCLIVLAAASTVIYHGAYGDVAFATEHGQQWLAHIPFVPFFVIAVFVVMATIGKIFWLFNNVSPSIKTHPLAAANLLMAVMGGLVMLAGIGIR